MIYRLLVDFPDPHNAFISRLYHLTGGSVPVPWNKRIARRLVGGSFGPLADIMFIRGLRAPSDQQPPRPLLFHRARLVESRTACGG
jgi:hypothetical protein